MPVELTQKYRGAQIVIVSRKRDAVKVGLLITTITPEGGKTSFYVGEVTYRGRIKRTGMFNSPSDALAAAKRIRDDWYR